MTPEQIEKVNSYGPFVHGVWTNGRCSIGNEERLGGRAELLATTLRDVVTRQFTRKQLATMSILDVGCYDGWLMWRLQDLPFGRMLGIEPRAKNIEKGRAVRDALQLPCRCEFRQGTLEKLPDVLRGEKFDIVVATGLLHHLESVPTGISMLKQACRSLLFLETICLPDVFETAEMEHALELKDITYFKGRKGFGVTGHKLESAYSDGSACEMTVVSIPSVETIRMILETKGFSNVSIEVDPVAFRKRVPVGTRRYWAVCMSARLDGKEQFHDRSAELAAEYESGVVTTLLPDAWCEALRARAGRPMKTGGKGRRPDDALVVEYAFGSPKKSAAAWAALEGRIPHSNVREIVRNLVFSPQDKIAVEVAKLAIHSGRIEEARQMLIGVVTRLNADWRAVYRAFCLLHWICKESGQKSAAAKYLHLCRNANPLFPESLLAGDSRMLRRAGERGAGARRGR